MASPKSKRKRQTEFWFVTHALVLLGCGVVFFLLGWKLIPLPQAYLDLLQRAVRGTVFIVIVLAIVRYLVPPREAGAVKTRLIPKLLAALNAEPDKVMFSAGANR